MTSEKHFLILWSTISVFSISHQRMPTIFFKSLRTKYLITVNMAAKFYIGIKLEWYYVHRTVTFSMPNYVRKALLIFQHILIGGKEYSPHTCAPIQYGQKVQYADPLDASEHISDK